MTRMLLTNARLFDGESADYPSMHILVQAEIIQTISERPIKPNGAVVIDLAGKTVMPGLIDAHIHAYFSDVDWHKVDLAGEAYRTAHAARMLGFALDCGFTTVRDIGGGDYGLWRAIEDGLIRAPRFYYAGKMISMTGGHGDTRLMHEHEHTQGYCSCGNTNALNVVADGVDECIKAAREELRRGAHCLKVMASGGAASPTDPIWMNQYREDEIRAIVREAHERQTYVSAHCHPVSAVRRCIEYGVRVIEHGTLMDDDTARFVAEQDTYVVPTMAIIHVLADHGPALGLSKASQAKIAVIRRQSLEGMDAMRRAGVKLGFGTDLLGETYVHQCIEFTIRKQVFSPIEILRQATSGNAAIMRLKEMIGCIREGAWADLLVVDGDPLKDIDLVAAQGRHLCLIMKGGKILKNTL